MDSQRHEQRQRQEIEDKIDQLEAQHDTGMHDYSWLRHALEQLCETRAILGYSYVFAYYMFGGEMFREEINEEQNEMNKNLFEDQQQQLDAEVCYLHVWWHMCGGTCIIHKQAHNNMRHSQSSTR